jgi:hypothetical protein
MRRAIQVFLHIILGLLIASLLGGCSAPINQELYQLAVEVLGGVFAIGGAAAAVGFSVIGVKIIVGNAAGSSYRTTEGVLALVGAVTGLVLMIVGPSIAMEVWSVVSGQPLDDVVQRAPQGLAYDLLKEVSNSVQKLLVYISIVGCAIGLSTVGVKIIIGNATGSGNSTGEGILAFISMIVGFILIFIFPQIVWMIYSVLILR